MKFHLSTAIVAALFAVAALVPAQALVVGVATNPSQSNSAPFGSAQAGYYYQQVFDDSAFSGPLTINQLTFYNTLLPGGSPNPGNNFQIYLAATTTQQVNAITDNFPSGSLFSSALKVFDGAIPALASGRLDFTLSQSFAYDPTGGTNLLLIVRNFDLSSSSSPLFLDSDTRGTVTSSRQYSGPNGPSGNLRTGLVTGFNVPEPSTWASLLAGLAMIGFMASRRRQRSPAIG